MIIRQEQLKTLLIIIVTVLAACATVEENPKKSAQLGLITTPPTYYTTQKARYLGEKYKSNLDRLVERIVSNPKTATLQFANNIASVGGIGFFTHSATSSADERFLEIIMGMPETFDSKLDLNAKVHRVFSLYGQELLSILMSDSDIYQEKDVNGYGLNLSWRNLVPDAAGPRISLERSTLYFSKAKVRSFLRGDLSQNTLLGEAVIFTVVDDSPMKLVSYRPQELRPDSRKSIQEELLIAGQNPTKPEVQGKKTVALVPMANQLMTAKEQEKISDPSSSLSSDSAIGSQASPAWNEAIPATAKATEPPAPSSAPIEPMRNAAVSMIEPREETLADKQEFNGRPPSTAGESNSIAPQYVPHKVDLASLPLPPVLAPTTDGPKVEGHLKEQPLSESKNTSTAARERSVGLSSTKVLQGFVIQLAFGDTRDARRWAETLERKGFTVSVTETDGSGSVRVRIGNFAGREEAERQLQALRQDGLKGIILNLPQAYRPEVRPVISEDVGKTVSAIQ